MYALVSYRSLAKWSWRGRFFKRFFATILRERLLTYRLFTSNMYISFLRLNKLYCFRLFILLRAFYRFLDVHIHYLSSFPSFCLMRFSSTYVHVFENVFVRINWKYYKVQKQVFGIPGCLWVWFLWICYLPLSEAAYYFSWKVSLKITNIDLKGTFQHFRFFFVQLYPAIVIRGFPIWYHSNRITN